MHKIERLIAERDVLTDLVQNQSDKIHQLEQQVGEFLKIQTILINELGRNSTEETWDECVSRIYLELNELRSLQQKIKNSITYKPLFNDNEITSDKISSLNKAANRLRVNSYPSEANIVFWALEIITKLEKTIAVTSKNDVQTISINVLERNRLYSLIDDVWNEATESQEVPHQHWADDIINKWLASYLPIDSTKIQSVDLDNKWDSIQDFIIVLQAMRIGQWHWPNNSRCKYVELRVDMRNGSCIIKDREGKRITPQELASQENI